MNSKHDLLRQPFQTYIFMDLEATGLQPSRPKITELCLIAVNRHALENTEYSIFRSVPVFPRVLDKLSLCVNPEKPFTQVASSITRLSNNLLNINRRQGFNIHIIQMLEAFFKRQTAPMCFVAHNGYGYDFPLLKAELAGIGFSGFRDIYCVDSMVAMRALDKFSSHLYQFAGQQATSGRKTYSLAGLYLKFFKENPPDSHTAEGDTIALIAIFQWRAKDLVRWIDLNAKQFDEIKAMYNNPLKELTEMASPTKTLGKIMPTQVHFLPEAKMLTSKTYRFYNENASCSTLKNSNFHSGELKNTPFNHVEEQTGVTDGDHHIANCMIALGVLIVLICLNL